MPARVDILGQRFGALVAVEDVDRPDRRGRWVRCTCDCGGEQIAPLNRLRIADDDPRAIRACEACRSKPCAICGAPFLKPGSAMTCGADACRLEYRRRVNAAIADRVHAANPTARLERQRRYRASEAGIGAQQRGQQRYYLKNRAAKAEADQHRYYGMGALKRAAAMEAAAARRRERRQRMTGEERGERRARNREYYAANRERIKAHYRQWIAEMTPERRAEWDRRMRDAGQRYRNRQSLAEMMADARKLMKLHEEDAPDE